MLRSMLNHFTIALKKDVTAALRNISSLALAFRHINQVLQTTENTSKSQIWWQTKTQRCNISSLTNLTSPIKNTKPEPKYCVLVMGTNTMLIWLITCFFAYKYVFSLSCSHVILWHVIPGARAANCKWGHWSLSFFFFFYNFPHHH